MPMMSTPSSVISPAMQAILVVPISRPTMISLVLVLAMGLLLILVKGDGDVVGTKVEMNGACARALGIGERSPRDVERLHARRELGVECADLDRDAHEDVRH